MPHIVVTILSFIVLLAIMVFVHELGHFIVAKFFKVRVEAFSIGMGPRLFGYKYGETDYRICAFPLGGYVMMTGENMPGENLGAEGDKEKAEQAAPVDTTPDPGALTSKPRWQRMLIGVAGPFANFVFAFVIMLGYFWFLNEMPPYVDKPITIDIVLPGSEAAKAGLQIGDVIQDFAGTQNATFEEVNIQAIENINHPVPLTILRNGQKIESSLFIKGDEKNPEEFDLAKLGFVAKEQSAPLTVKLLTPGKAADQAGVKNGDVIYSVDGIQLHSVEALLPYLQAQAGKPLNLVVLRNGVQLNLVAHPQLTEVPDKRGPWRLGFAPEPPAEYAHPLNFQDSAIRSWKNFRDNSTMIFDVLGRILTHRMSVKTLSGPIGMAQMAGDVAETPGIGPKFLLGAAISINLGILNLLPIPILDGGMIFILIIESIRRKDLSMNLKERIYQVAFVFLMVLMAFIIFNDISKFSIFHH
jgi:regulator of sigma E protease